MPSSSRRSARATTAVSTPTAATWDGVAVHRHVSLNNTYWARVDYLLTTAASAGMTVILNRRPFACNGHFRRRAERRVRPPVRELWHRDRGPVQNTAEHHLGVRRRLGVEALRRRLVQRADRRVQGAGATHMVTIENNLESTARQNMFDNSVNAWGRRTRLQLGVLLQRRLRRYRVRLPGVVAPHGAAGRRELRSGTEEYQKRNLVWWGLSLRVEGIRLRAGHDLAGRRPLWRR